METKHIFSSSSVFYLFISFIAFLIVVKRLLKPKSHKKLPPGPWTLPFIGNLHQLTGSLPHRILKNMSDKHGPLMRIMMGERTTIIVSSARMAKLVLHTNGLSVANRPINSVAEIICYNNLGTTFAKYGEYLKQLRQLYMLELLSTKRVKSFWGIFENELEKFVGSIELEVEKPLTIYWKSTEYLYAAICRVMFGSVCSERDKLIKVCKKVSKLSAAPIRFEDLFPSIKGLSFLTGTDSVLKGLVKDLDDVLDKLISERENSCSTLDEGDMLGILLKIKKGDLYNSKLQITNDDIKAIIFELMLAATLSVADVVEWAFVEIIRYPEVLRQVKEELRQVLKGKKTITGDDLEKMEYLHMCVKESTRLHPAAPLLFPREAREEFHVDEEYTIPKGSWIMTNYWAIGRDPEIWPKPDEFDPERFRNSNMDFYGNNFELIPFGAGRRGCPGILFGITEAEFLLAGLFYHFDWELPGGITPKEIDMTEVFGAGCILKNPLSVIPVLADN